MPFIVGEVCLFYNVAYHSLCHAHNINVWIDPLAPDEAACIEKHTIKVWVNDMGHGVRPAQKSVEGTIWA